MSARERARRRRRSVRRSPRGRRGRRARPASACSAAGSRPGRSGSPSARSGSRRRRCWCRGRWRRPCARCPASSAVSTSSSNTFGERVEPRPITGPEPSGWLPTSFSSTPGASVAWVTSTAIARSGRTSKAEVRAPNRPISSWTAATAAKLALERAALVAAAQRLQRDVGAEAVVHRARDKPVAGEADRLGGDHRPGRRPGPAPAASSRSAAPMSMWRPFELDDLFALLGLEQVDRLAADDAGHEAVPAAHLDPLADEDLRVPAADRAEVEEALLVDVGDDEADLVDVADDGEQRRLLADPGDRGAEAVAGERGEGGGLAPDLGRRRPRSPDGAPARSSLSSSSGVSAMRDGQYAESPVTPCTEDSNSFSNVDTADQRRRHRRLERHRRGDGEAPRARAGRRAGPRRPPRGAPARARRVAALPARPTSPST